MKMRKISEQEGKQQESQWWVYVVVVFVFILKKYIL